MSLSSFTYSPLLALCKRLTLLAFVFTLSVGCSSLPMDFLPLLSGGRLDSNLAAAGNGGGCYPLPFRFDAYEQLTLVNPEWSAPFTGMGIDIDPTLVHGLVMAAHGDLGGNFPATHGSSDVSATLKLDDNDGWLRATGNGGDDATLDVLWERGSYPAWAWPSVGDRLVALGRWSFDCAHPGTQPGHCSQSSDRLCNIDSDCQPTSCATCAMTETCAGATYNYVTQLHPPQAAATIRQGRGQLLPLENGMQLGPATSADVWVSSDGGGAGDRCLLTHQEQPLDLLYSTDCFPLAEPVAQPNAQDFSFDLPLPPRPSDGAVAYRVIPHDAAGGIPAKYDIVPQDGAAEPHLTVFVHMSQMTEKGMPTGFAATIVGGWLTTSVPLVHVRVSIDAIAIKNSLRPAVPIVREVKAWNIQAAVSGEYQELTGLGAVNGGDLILQNLIYDQYLPPDGVLRIMANGTSRACVDTMLGKSLKTSSEELGLVAGATCLQTRAQNPGTADAAYAGPDFGAGLSGQSSYETPSTGGDGGYCSLTTTQPCLSDSDCTATPGEICKQTGAAFALRYTISRLP